MESVQKPELNLEFNPVVNPVVNPKLWSCIAMEIIAPEAQLTQL